MSLYFGEIKYKIGKNINIDLWNETPIKKKRYDCRYFLFNKKVKEIIKNDKAQPCLTKPIEITTIPSGKKIQ